MAKLSKVKQDELITVEVERYNKIFEYLQEDKKRIAQRLIERVAFMTIQLQILEDNIKTKGPTYEFINGKQRMIIENPAQKTYNTLINRYTAAYEKLFALLPKDGLNVDTSDDDDGFESFVMNK